MLTHGSDSALDYQVLSTALPSLQSESQSPYWDLQR
jgi:hypothetical protein